MPTIIEPIEPFNEIYYQSCLYNSLFPVIGHFQRSILPLLINDWAVYEAARTGEDLLCGISYRSNKGLMEALAGLGIAAGRERFAGAGTVVGQIKRAVDKGRPVILWVDCYELPIRMDTFRRKHSPHTLLVHGYDDCTGHFHIIEHLQMENLSYDKKTIRMEDLERAYIGFDQEFNQGGPKLDSYYEFYKLDQGASSISGGADQYRELIRSNMNAITDGLDQLLEVSELLYGRLMQQTHLSIDFASQQLDKLNSIILAKQAESYKLKLLQMEQEPLSAILQSITNEWSMIRTTVGKYVYSSQFHAEQFAELPDRINNIYDAELKFYEAFLE
ncbi:BtrH N-terminal domain-containing protein [Paenibacillus tepidiphilus]|uniref:BtrH N-terminal domain-containing protein n=1 Tax=Paenibacillus tepidiphilus TaxID=2608683 RepID=UPI00123C2204|nr:BtrH N-terminal domain-containing protein [Paenibacillus tepidiphilus]